MGEHGSECDREYASFIPKTAKTIEDAAAKHMLSRMQYVPIKTELAPSMIHTSHVISAGQKDKPSLIFLHGFDSNLLEFRYMLPIFDETPYECHFIDIFGWGLTEKPKPTPENMLNYGPVSKRLHLKAYIRNMVSSREIILVGTSIGGAVAIDLLLNWDDKDNIKIKSLILIDAQAFIDKEKTFILNIPGIAEIGTSILRSDWLRKKAAQLSYVSNEFKYGDDVLRIGKLGCFSDGWFDATVDFVRGQGYCVSNRVVDIDIPTLIIWGEFDKVLPKGDAHKFLKTIRNSRLQYIPQTGHSPHIENGIDVSNRILHFI